MTVTDKIGLPAIALPGVNGKSIHYGYGPPAQDQGAIGELYIDFATSKQTIFGKGPVYGWQPVGEFRGLPGKTVRGPQGAGIVSGTAAPDELTADEGYFYIQFGLPQGPLLFGPRVRGQWGTGVPLQGVQGLTPVGPWQTGTFYTVGPPASCREQNGSSYQCLITHVSNIFADDLAAGKWGLIASAGDDGVDAGSRFNWATATSGDPGTGKIRANNALLSSATEIAVSERDVFDLDLSSLIGSWTASTNPVKGSLRIRSRTSESKFSDFNVTAVVDSGAYRTLTVTPVTSFGAFTSNESVIAVFLRTGDRGTDGDANAALAAQTAAETARNGAVSARDTAIDARNTAQTAAATATTKAGEALSSKTAAQTAETNITAIFTDMSAVNTAVTTSGANATTATNAKNAAEAARDLANTYKDAAATSAASASAVTGIPVLGLPHSSLTVNEAGNAMVWSKRNRILALAAL